MEFESKNENYVNAQVRAKASDCIKIFFEPYDLVQKALKEVEKYTHIMDFTKIRVIESMFALLRRGTTNIIEYNDNHNEFPMSDEQIFTYMSKWLIISMIWGFGGSLCLGDRTDFSEKLKQFTLDIEFPNDDNFQMIDYYVDMGENKWNPSEAMVEFYTQCQARYTPDIHPHYIYSPRELTRWKDVINESIENISNEDSLVRLWAQEALRLFQDRLVLEEEKKWCDELQ